MLNREKYAKEILDIACNGDKIAVRNGKITSCDDLLCKDCDFGYSDCNGKTLKWANSEYVESPVDWSKVAVDTPILVRDSEEEAWRKRHFAKYENGIVYAWGNGTTSWSEFSSGYLINWKFAKLAESEGKK